MSGGSGLDLGDVGFSLTADTAGLDNALATLRRFGDEVNRWERKTDEAAASVTTAYMRQEKAMVSMFQKMQNLQAQMKRVDAPADIADKATASLQRYVNKLSETSKAGAPVVRSALEMQRAMSSATGEYSKAVNALKNWQIQARSTAKAQEELNKQSALASKGRLQQAIENISPKSATRYSAKASAQTFINAGMMAPNSDAHVSAYLKEQAAIRKVTDLANANANAHVRLYQTKQLAMQRDAEQAAANANAHVAAYRKEIQAIEARNAALKASTINRAERVTSVATQRVERINDKAQRFSVSPTLTGANTQNLQSFRQAMFAGDANKARASLLNLNAGLKQTQDEISKVSAKGKGFSETLRGMQGATVLAAGPLSGLGARTAVVANLFDSMSAKAALLIVGLTGVGVAIGVTATEAVKARIAYEQWNSLMIAASGSIALAGGEMEYVTKIADKYGFSIRGLIPSYGSFATSARLANVTLEEQRDIFESFTTAGAALHWTTEQSGRAFLALEQMMSKGVVQTQEMKLQLGQVLPGAMEIAAKAVGMTNAKFMKAMEEGAISTKDNLGKIAAEVKKVYGEAAKYGAISIQADIGRFDTKKFQLAKAFDDAIGASKIFQGLLRKVTEAMEWLSQNATKAIAGFVAGMAVLATAYLPLAISGMKVLVGHMTRMTVLGGIMTAFSSGNLLKGVVQLAAMAGVGYAAYKLMNQELDKTDGKTQEVINTTAIAMGQYKSFGEITKREKEAHLALLNTQISKVKEHIKNINQETKAVLLLAKSVTVLSEAERQRRIGNITGQAKQSVTRMGYNPTMAAFGMDAGIYEPDADSMKKFKAKKQQTVDSTPEGKNRIATQKLQTQLAQLEKLQRDFESVKVTPEPSADTSTADKAADKAARAAEKARTQYENVYESAKKSITDFDAIVGKQRFIELQYKIGPISEEDLARVFDRKEAEKEVNDFFEGMKDKTKDSFVQKLSNDFQGLFNARGIKGNTLQERLVNLKVETKANERALARSTQQLLDFNMAADRAALALQSFNDAQKNVQKEIDLADAGFKGQESANTLKAKQDIEEKMRELRSKLSDEVLATDSTDFIKFSARLDTAQALEDAYRLREELKADKEITLNKFGGIESTISSTEASAQSLVVAGVLSESEARNKVRTTMREQIAAAGDLLQKMEALRALASDPSEIAGYDARIAKLKEMAAIGAQVGAQEGVISAVREYANETVDAFQNAHDVTLKLMKGMENAIVEFAMTGKTSVKDMAKSIIESLIRIEAQKMIVAGSGLLKAGFGLVMGMMGGGGGAAAGAATGATMMAAQGMAFSGPGISAYSNSVVNSPTVFPFAKGVGLIGEKPASTGEAVMPLTRDGSGDLAVSAVGLDKLGGGGSISVSISYIDNRQTSESTQGSGSSIDRAKASEFSQLMKSIVVSTIMQEKRPGGMLE